MDCREFERLLPRYLEGALDEPLLGRMIRHESSCARCHGLASEGMRDPAEALANPAWTEETLRRTLGADCDHIALRLAERMDADRPAADAERIERHLAECPACRALAAALADLPACYRALPRLRAGSAFTRAVMLRTVGREPRLRTLLRAFWHSPALLWEGALACSLIFTPLLGQPALEGIEHLDRHLRAAYAEARRATTPARAASSPLSLEALERWSAAVGQCCGALRSQAESWALPLLDCAEAALEDLHILAPDDDAGASQGGHDELQQP